MVEDFKKVMPHLKFTPCEFKIEPEKVPDEFPNWAVWLSNDMDRFTMAEAHIMPAKVVKKHGVIPGNGKPGYFNCVVGDYEEADCVIYLKNVEYGTFDFLAHTAWLPEGYSKTSCIASEVGKLLHHRDGLYGFFYNKKDAIDACQLAIKCKLVSLDQKIEQIKFTSSTLAHEK